MGSELSDPIQVPVLDEAATDQLTAKAHSFDTLGLTKYFAQFPDEGIIHGKD
jgi:hypothetical protein